MLSTVGCGWSADACAADSDNERASSGAAKASPEGGGGIPVRVLFVGNSYTYYNNLPEIVEEIAAARPAGPVIEAELVARGSATLASHLHEGAGRRMLGSGSWNFVVLQEQSLWGGSIVDGLAELGDIDGFHDAVRRWVSIIREREAEPILYMTWARRDPPGRYVRLQAQLASGYDQIGKELGIPVAPVGLAWAEAHSSGDLPSLYESDGSHPTAIGTYLAACVIYSTITGLSPIGAPSTIRGYLMETSEAGIALKSVRRAVLVELKPEEALAIQQAAWRNVSQRMNGDPAPAALVRP